MATLPTPILSIISTFDPKNTTNISFTYSGSQIKSKRIIVTNNATSKVVIDNTQLGMKLSYELASNTLQPGQYTARLQVFDFNGNSSELSQPVLFYCYTTPTLKFLGLKDKITTASIQLNLSYSQSENDGLKEYVYYLYDANMNLVEKSSVFYNSDHYTYTFLGIKNLSRYYARCIGKTIHGMNCDTGYCEFTVEYIVNPNNMLVELINNYCEGYISINCNIIDIGYKIEGDGDPKFENGQVVLDNKKITYFSGFDLSDEFSMFVKARRAPLNTPFFGYDTSNGSVELSIQKIAAYYYCVLTAKSAIGNYYRYVKMPGVMLIDKEKNSITDENGNYVGGLVTLDNLNDYIVVFEVKRKDNLYSLKAYYENNGYIEIK